MITLHPLRIFARTLSVLAVALALLGAGASLGSAADADWIGHSRADVLTTLGKPISVLQRGDTEVLMFPNNVRVEIRAEKVVAFRSGAGASIVASDGTRYVPGEHGKVQLFEESNTTPAPPGLETEETVFDEAADSGEAEDDAKEIESSGTDASTDVAGAVADLDEQLLKLAADPANIAQLAGAPEPEPAPAWMQPTGLIIGALLRFGVALLVLRIAIAWVNLPVYMPDVVKVAALYVVIREGMHGLGELGGEWEFINLFRIDEVASFFALCFLLVAFKIVFTGLTALRIAAMTKVATFAVMLIATLAITFGFAALR